MSEALQPNTAAMPAKPSMVEAFTRGQPLGVIAPPPPQQQQPLSQPPAHAVQSDPAVLAVELLDEAVKRAGRKLLADTVHDLPDALDRYAARRYAWIILAVSGGLLAAGFALGLGYSAQGMACDTLSSPGWKHCWQWIGGVPAGAPGHAKP